MRVYNLPKNEIDDIVELMGSQLGAKPAKKLKNVRVVEIEEDQRIIVYGESKIAQFDNILAPFLGDANAIAALPAVVVDPGAIKFVCNGADVMRPGIVRIDGDFAKGARVAVKESTHGKAIAVGEALLASNEMREAAKGAVVKNLHYVGDKLWEGFKQVNL